MTKKANLKPPVIGRALGTVGFLALVHRTAAGPMKTSKRDISRGEAKRRALLED